MTDGYAPIGDYAAVGNLETVALVSRRGSVDWLPLPHVESPSVFAAILDDERGGRFAVRPEGSFEAARRYLDRTNVLETTFRTASGTVEVIDFMPVRGRVADDRRALHRRVACTDGSVDLEIVFDPRFDYARDDPALEPAAFGLVATGETDSLRLTCPVELSRDGSADGTESASGDGPATGTLALDAGDTEWLSVCHGGGAAPDAECERALDDTVAFWREWTHDCDDIDRAFVGDHHGNVVRSELALKLLTHRETGAVAAAPTTSLPEDVGGVRNWDYRYNWLRDAAFAVAALANLGHGDEAEAYVEWFLDRCDADDPGGLRPLYGLHGRGDLGERTLDHLEGYRGSAPVRVGNAAADQTQLDTYGELVLAVNEAVECGMDLDADDWTGVRAVVDHAAEQWTESGAGIWEVRSGPEQFVFSKVMCWLALDRGLALADRYGFDAPRDRWRDERATVRETVLDRGYDADRGTFVRSFGDGGLDATALLVPVVGFLPFDDDRVLGTIQTIESELGHGDGLVRRYDGDDGLAGDEGAFLWCTFWLADALALTGRVERAREVFDGACDYANGVGLLAEEVDPADGSLLGNFPQGFSHVGVLDSALYLAVADGRRPPGPEPLGLRLGENAAIE